MLVVLLFDSLLENSNFKELSNDTKMQFATMNKEGHKTLSQRFKVSTVRNTVMKWNATGTVLVKERCEEEGLEWSETDHRPPLKSSKNI